MMMKNLKNLVKFIFHLSIRMQSKLRHKHKLNTLNYASVFGKIKLVLYDDRKDSSTFLIKFRKYSCQMKITLR